jgi:hypothetical protein
VGFHLMRRCAAFFFLLVLAWQQVACGQREYEWQPLFPEGQADLVVVFKEGITPQEIIRFEEEELIIGQFEEGFSHRAGVGVVARKNVNGRAAYALTLDSSATPEEREKIREGVKSSPYVYRVFENVAAEDIDLDEMPETSEEEG